MEMRRSILFRCFLLCVLAILSLPACAYLRAAPEDSLEWIVFDSDVIVRGVVSHIDDKSADKSFSHSVVTLSVLETLKGPAGKSLTFVNEFGDINRWKTGEHLFFFINTPRYTGNQFASTQQVKVYSAYPLVIRNATFNRDPIPLIGKLDRAFFDAQFHPLQTPEAILSLVRYEAANPPKIQFGLLEIHISSSSQIFMRPQDRLTYQPAYLNLLVDHRAEARAREWVKSTDPWDRWNGAMVLSHFQSPQNVALLTPLLNDKFKAESDWPGGSDFRLTPGSGRWRQIYQYPMRHIAYNALKEWRAAPPEAILFEPAYATTYLNRRTVPLTFGAAGLLIVLVVAMRWVRPLRWIGGFTGLSVLLFIATAVLWARSRWMIDEVSVSTAPKVRCEVASIDGALRVMRIESVDEPTPATFTSVKRDPACDRDWNLSAIQQIGTIRATETGRAGFKAQTGGIWSDQFSVQAYRAYSAPLWAFCVLFSLFPAIRLTLWLRRRRRVGENGCPNCGYDLRATPQRCPECGKAVAGKSMRGGTT
jgi:hypothetical protein